MGSCFQKVYFNYLDGMNLNEWILERLIVDFAMTIVLLIEITDKIGF